jgi:predicted flap endonuclease-1-like 5' DNA nuclease
VEEEVMTAMIEANWVAFVLALLIGLAVAWWLFGRATAPRQRTHRPDVLDEGAAPAGRNQALIDAPSATAAALAATGPDVLGGIGELAALGVQTELREVPVVNEEEVAAALDEGPADDLTRIKGVGPKLVLLLAGLGVTRFAQIAEWSEADLARIDAQLGAFAGRPQRDNWIEQARLLASGDTAAYEAKFGKL